MKNHIEFEQGHKLPGTSSEALILTEPGYYALGKVLNCYIVVVNEKQLQIFILYKPVQLFVEVNILLTAE